MRMTEVFFVQSYIWSRCDKRENKNRCQHPSFFLGSRFSLMRLNFFINFSSGPDGTEPVSTLFHGRTITIYSRIVVL